MSSACLVAEHCRRASNANDPVLTFRKIVDDSGLLLERNCPENACLNYAVSEIGVDILS